MLLLYEFRLILIRSKKETRIHQKEKHLVLIYGNKIVWQDKRGVSPNADGDNYYDLYVYDLSTKKETQITHSGEANGPTIYGNRIVCQEGSYGYYDVCMYDLSTKKQTQITKGGFAYEPVIGGNRILWV